MLSKLKFYQIKDILATFGLKKGTFFIHQTRNRGEILAFWVWDMQLKTSHLKGWPRTGIREFYFLFVRHAGQARGREEQAILSVISWPYHYPGPCAGVSHWSGTNLSELSSFCHLLGMGFHFFSHLPSHFHFHSHYWELDNTGTTSKGNTAHDQLTYKSNYQFFKICSWPITRILSSIRFFITTANANLPMNG